MGEVYRAKDHRLGREIAIKVLPAEVSSRPDRLARFEREARSVAGINHPNVVVLHSVEDQDGVRFLTMELVEGQTLSTLIVPGGLPLAKLLDLAIPMTEALAAAHERGVVHRDLKPGNVMVTREGRLKVLDFGLAKMLDPESPAPDGSMTVTGQTPVSSDGHVLGTVPYMAPEQLRGETVDARSDLFSLGIILYELATGVRPFVGRSSAEITSSILRDTPAPLPRVRANVPASLGRIVARCLEKNPAQRFQTALDVCGELRRILRPDGSSPDTAPPALASIAVLPFLDMGGDPENAYFSDGLAEELLNVLAKIRGLRVAARSSAFTFRGRNVSVAEVGMALGVSTVLEGSVRKAGNRVRVGVQLVNVTDGYQLWTESYDRTLDDIFAVQDDIAQSVVKALRKMLAGEASDSSASDEVKVDVAEAARGRGHDAESHRLYLQGRYLVDRFTREDLFRGIETLQKAIEIDPGNALAWAQLSKAYSLRSGYGWGLHAEGVARGREAARRALELETDLVEGHVALAFNLMTYDWDWGAAEVSFRRALELAPRNPTALTGVGWLLRATGRLDEAITHLERAVEQDPLSSTAYHDLATTLYYAGRLQAAETGFHKTLELSPTRTETRSNLAMVLLRSQRAEEALREATLEPVDAFGLCARAIVHHTQGRGDESNLALRALQERYSNDGAYQIAEVHAVRGEMDAAFAWLDRACAQQDGGLMYLLGDPLFEEARRDPRWRSVLARMRLPA